VKVVTPTPLLAEAAEVLGPFRDEVVVIGAAALEVALAEVAPGRSPCCRAPTPGKRGPKDLGRRARPLP
jgi:hypothetical protein